MSQPKVSVLITAYNRDAYIARAIQSVMMQDFRDWELIVADDGSTDRTEEIVREFAAQDSRIKCFRSGHLGRIAKISNFGLAHATGEYVAVLDSDDYWADAGKLKKQAEFLDTHSDYAACGGGFIAIDFQGKEIGKFLKSEQDENIKKRALYANQMANSTAMFRRDMAQAVGGYDETLMQFADWDFWLNLGTKGRLYNFQEYFARYRMWEDTASFGKQRECARSAWRIVWRYRNAYPRFLVAALYWAAYSAYAYMPVFIKRNLNLVLSKAKKALFQS